MSDVLTKINSSEEFFKRIKIVVMDVPYDVLHYDLAKQIFINTLSLKLMGYQSVYSYGVLPIDTYDFIGTSLLVTLQLDNGEHYILAGQKAVTLNRCTIHKQEFPGVVVAKKMCTPECSQEIERIVNKCKAENIGLSYDASWTINPELKNYSSFLNLVIGVSFSMEINFHLDYNIKEWVVVGIKKVGTDKYFERTGCKTVSANPEFKFLGLDNADAVMYHHDGNYSLQTMQRANRYKHVWDNRLVLNKSYFDKVKDKAISRELAIAA